jgi:hypothetical protein
LEEEFMNKKENIERSLKRFLKRKITFTTSLLVAFLITGGIGLASSAQIQSETESTKMELLDKISEQKAGIQALLEENEAKLKQLGRSQYELVRKGDDYSKITVPTSQVFFTYSYLNSGKSKDNTEGQWKETIDEIKKVILAGGGASTPSSYVDGTISGSNEEAIGLLKGYSANGKSTPVGANGVVSIEEGQEIELDLGVNITLHEPEIPIISKSVTANVTTINVIPPSITVTTPTAPSAPTAPSVSINVNVVAPGATSNILITPPTAPTPTVPGDKNISVAKPATPSPFEPKMIVPPSEPASPTIVAPTMFTPPTLPFVGTGFYQGWGIGSVNGAKKGSIDSSIIIENYQLYQTPTNTETNPFQILTGNDGSTILGGMKWSNGTVYASSTEFTYSETLSASSVASSRSAFINELRDHDATIDGHYSMTYVGGDKTTIPADSYTKMFISHNPAGRNTGETGTVALAAMTGWLGQSVGAKTAKFTGTLELHGSSRITPVAGSLYEILVGIEHQLWDTQDNYDGYSVFENAGKITLASGNNVIGIMIDTEALNDRGRDKHNNNQTKNTGTIIINSTNSIGIDFGAYQAYTYIPLDVTLGNIQVNSTNNYGFRMKNIFTSNPVYYDDVTISGGIGKVTVGGTNNVGLAIGKSLSSTANPHTEVGNLNYGTLVTSNPISNFFGINVEIIGDKVIGFLRQSDYSNNNSGDFIFNAQTMGTFNIGDNAQDSTLIRSDYGGIDIRKNITTTGTSTAGGNVVAHANGQAQHIYNSAVITTGSGLVKTTGLASTGTAGTTKDNIRNTGTIQIGGKESVGMYVDQFTRGLNTGTIKMTGTEKNTGVVNLGNFSFSGTVEANGAQSTGLYNKGTFALPTTTTTTIKTTNGATGIFGEAGTFTSNIGDDLVIEVDDTLSLVNKGLAVYAKSGAVINIPGADITVLEGAAGVASYGTGSDIKLNNATIDYDGTGYAAYSDGLGKIDLSGAQVILRGEAVGLELDMALGSPTITLASTMINVQSLDAIGLNIVNLPTSVMTLDLGDTNVSHLNAALAAALGSVTFTGLTGYTQAAVENGTLNINTPLDKSIATGTSGFYYRNFLSQALKLNVKANITAELTNAQAAYFANQVAAIEMSSSKLASGLSQTQVNIDNGVTVKAGRTEVGDGAIGVFINYGEMINNGDIEIESAAENDGGVGIYAVNGAKVDNTGTITTYGDKAIGILGSAYRKLNGPGYAGKEFGGKLGEGIVEITNNGDIIADGDKAVGIYLENNSRDTSVAVGSQAIIKAINNDTITMNGDSAAGIYAEGDGAIAETIVQNYGTIEVSKDGVGIFADNAVDIQKVGTLKLGEEAIGIVLDNSSKITDTATIIAQATTTVGNKTVLALKSGTVGVNDPTAQTIGLNINSSTLDKGINIYLLDRGATGTTISSTGTLTVGAEGVGIYAENSHTTNNGTITLDIAGTVAVGMYTKNGTIINNTGAIINVNKDGQLGMVAKNTAGIVINNGTINLNDDVTTGIYIANGATVTDALAGSIVFTGATESFGIAANAANVDLNGGTYTLNNADENIYVYGENGSDIDILGAITVDGVTSAPDEKSVGIYLNGTNDLSNTNTLTAQNGIVGVYSKGNNVIDGGTYAAQDDKTIGIYIENNAELKNLTVKADATPATANVVAIYGTGGVITVTGGLNVALAGTGMKGTGIYLSNGAYLTGDDITISNGSTTTNAGIYYTGTGTLTNGVDINLSGNNLVGLFLDGGITLNNNKEITYAGTSDVGAFIRGNSTYVSSSLTDNISTANSVGAYAEDGKVSNIGTMIVSNTTSAALIAVGNAVGKTARAENSGTLSVSAGVAILLGDLAALGESIGKNTGTINVTTGGATGVVVGLGDTTFDGTGGTINITGSATAAVGLYLDGTITGQVTNSGTLNLLNANSVGIYADNNAKVDFPVTLTGTAGIGLFADNGVVVSGTIDASGSINTTGMYLNGTTGATVTFNNGIIKAGQSPSLTAIGLLMNGLGAYTLQNVKVTSSGVNSLAVSGINGTIINYNAEITANNNAIGIYIDSTSTLNGNAGIINIGNNAIGIYIDGGTGNIGTLGSLNINFTGTGGIAVYSAGGSSTTFGGNIIITGVGSLAVVENGNQSNTGNMTAENGSVAFIGQYDAGALGYTPTYTVSNSGILTLETGGIGMAAVEKPLGTTPAPGDVIVNNTGTINVEDAGSVGIYSDIADIDNNGGVINATDGGIGIYAKGNARLINFGDIQVTKGVGVVIDGGVATTPVGTITVNSGDASNYSVGAFYRNVTAITTLPNINLLGNYALAALVEGTGTVTYANPITIGTSGGTNHDQIFLKVQGDILMGVSIDLVAGSVDVYGDKNVGVYGDISNMTLTNVTVNPSSASADKSTSSIGVYGVKSDITVSNIDAGDNTIGVYSDNTESIVTAGNVTVGKDAVGIYGTGSGNYTDTINVTGNLTVGNNRALGIYGNDIDIVTGTGITIGYDNSIGIVSEGVGNVTIGGNVGVVNVATKGNDEGSIALYKKGAAGTINTSGLWIIGDEGYGIYIEQTGTGAVTVNNSADITLGESAVGSYINRNVTLNNSGYITVGTTNFNGNPSDSSIHQNSVGIYMAGGSHAVNTGIIDVLNSHSTGIYGKDAGTLFENNGTINVDNGGTGVLIKNGARAINNGIINILSGNMGTDSKISVGMAAYDAATIINSATGIINAGAGVGMYVGTLAYVDNQGIINITDGIGITGEGTVINQGTINVSGTGTTYAQTSSAEIEKGSVRIDRDGNIYLNDGYVGRGGTVQATSNVVLNGAYFGIEQFINTSVPVVSTQGIISGEVKLLPNFTTIGNGNHWEIKDFTDYFATPGTPSKIKIMTSPMYLSKIVGKDLILYKRPYADMVIGKQFDNLHNGLDDLLRDDGSTMGSNSFKMLTEWHEFLEYINNGSGEEAYDKALAAGLAEMRGDVYATTQKRMDGIQQAFDSSFNELNDSYNTSKDSSKYSIMYSGGDYKDPTVGIDDYEYKIEGLMYMKEKEGKNYGDKWGYYVGFAASKFDFDDGKIYGSNSSEKVYSMRLGVHHVHNLSDNDTLSLTSRLELGFNRHETERVIELDRIYKNKGEYDSYNISFDNKLEKVLTRGYKHQIGIYGSLNMEYGKIDKFTEKGIGGSGAELEVKGRDYFKVESAIGIKGEIKGYIGNKVSAKVFGDIGYAYQLNGESYKTVRARVSEGTSDYYNLIKPEKERGNIRGKLGLTIEKSNKLGVTFDVEAIKYNNKEKTDLQYGIKVKYVF